MNPEKADVTKKKLTAMEDLERRMDIPPRPPSKPPSLVEVKKMEARANRCFGFVRDRYPRNKKKVLVIQVGYAINLDGCK